MEGFVNTESEMIWKEVVVVQFEVLSPYIFRSLTKTSKILRVVRVPAEISIAHLPDTRKTYYPSETTCSVVGTEYNQENLVHHSPCSIALQPLWPLATFSSSLIYTQLVGHLGRVFTPSQGRYLHTGQHKQNKRTYIYPDLKWDSNSRSQLSRERRLFTPYTARPL
jgi:hypothetical protein